jgi:hypothetical protein
MDDTPGSRHENADTDEIGWLSALDSYFIEKRWQRVTHMEECKWTVYGDTYDLRGILA